MPGSRLENEHERVHQDRRTVGQVEFQSPALAYATDDPAQLRWRNGVVTPRCRIVQEPP
jgi:hypothetical protein